MTLERVRTLKRELTTIGADVAQFNRFAGMVRLDPVPVFLSRAGIHHEQQVVLRKAIDQQIVDYSSGWSR